NEQTQYFSFDNDFEKLLYKKIEEDERELIDVEDPFDRIYMDLAFCYLQLERYDSARDALKRAIRWNPMNMAYRLNLAELYRVDEDGENWLTLSYSVLERAYQSEHLIRAYLNFVPYMMNLQKVSTAAALTNMALRFDLQNPRALEAAQALRESGHDPLTMDDDFVEKLLEEVKIPAGVNAVVVATALMFANEAELEGDQEKQAYYTKITSDLVGEEVAENLRQGLKDYDDKGLDEQ
ncbi:MAG: tetratricopeptide repeat protein, partial [Coriobacteriia bacterium]|nr:tetratricopeptide repeat protein [Coriobacteriia bacterium]